MENKGFDPKKFYLGNYYDQNNEPTDERLLYNPADLNTHEIILGMTGSGKTGLGIITLEEIALKGIPAIIIDPKGDLTNMLLHFKRMQGSDIAPFLDPEAPAREGVQMEEYAAEKAASWLKGQMDSYFDPSMSAAEKEDALNSLIDDLNQVEYTVFTPGSNVGNPINIMGSFSAPEQIWSDFNDESIREEIATSVTALLGLVGMTNIDPIKSKEHILLSNIIEYYWSGNRDVKLTDMITAITDPPFLTLGALDVDTVYPRKERMKLAMQINNFLASPTFKAWNQGPALDLEGLIRNKDGKPRFNIFYIQHLSDQERMFFVTMLYSQIESWMRTQTGTGNLRLVVYFDEMAGYIPPNGNPASKTVMLRMLKQARAYGVGMILASQNPIDIDYKGLSNAGTWFVGHLQTEQDKNRLLDGLSTTEGQINRNQADKLISNLKKRCFLYMNIHQSGLRVMTTRWTLNYLAGPLTRTTIPLLVERDLSVPYSQKDAAAAKRVADGYTEDEEEAIETDELEVAPEAAPVWDGHRPEVDPSINEYFLSVTKSPEEAGAADDSLTYVPYWIAQAETEIENAGFKISKKIISAAEVSSEEKFRGNSIRWSKYIRDPFDLSDLRESPEGEAFYAEPPLWMLDPKSEKANEIDFIDWITKTVSISVLSNEKLNMFALKNETDSDAFIALCKEQAEELIEKEREKLVKANEANTTMKTQMARLEKAKAELEELQSNIENNPLASFRERLHKIEKSLNSSTRRSELEKAEHNIAQLEEKIEERKTELEIKLETKLDTIRDKWYDIAEHYTEVKIPAGKRDITIEAFGICWMPYYKDDNGNLISAF